ncbi:MAG TPA: tetratricopeptide repeat protein, partial [Candidatus Tectomicrobia bacterium]
MDGYAGQREKRSILLLRLVLVPLICGFLVEFVCAAMATKSDPSALQPTHEAPVDETKDRPSPAAYFFYMVGYYHELNQRFSDAQAAYQLALEYDPDTPVLISSMVSVMGRSGDVRGAISLAEQALQKHPQATSLRLLLGTLLSSLHERQAAITQFQEVLQLDPTIEEAYLSLGTLYEEERNYSAARSVLESLLARHPGS